MCQERVFLVCIFSSRHEICHIHDALRALHIGGGDPDRFETIFKGKIQPRDCKLIRRSVIRQVGYGEDIISGQFIDEMCDLRDVR